MPADKGTPATPGALAALAATAQPLSHGIRFVRDGDTLALILNVGPQGRENAVPSSTGKMRMIGTTHGFASIPGLADIKASVNIGLKA